MVGEGFTFPLWLDPRSQLVSCPTCPSASRLAWAARPALCSFAGAVHPSARPLVSQERWSGGSVLDWQHLGGAVKIKLVGPDPSTLGLEFLRLELGNLHSDRLFGRVLRN